MGNTEFVQMEYVDKEEAQEQEALPKEKKESKPKKKKLERMLDFLLKSGWPICPMITGSQGSGKTERVKAWAKEHGRDLVIIHLASHEPSDIAGLPTDTKLKDVVGADNFFMRAEKFTPDAEQGERIVTTWATPTWIAALRPGSVVFLDEINRAPQFVLNATFPLFFERHIHGHKLPEDTVVLAAQNPDNRDFQVTRVTDKAFISRFLHIPYAVDTLDWFTYVKNKGCHKALIEAVESDPKSFLGNSTPSVYEDLKLSSDPRNLDIIGTKILPNMTAEEFDDFGIDMLNGIVGIEKGATIFNAFKNGLTTIDPKDILLKYNKKTKEYVKDLCNNLRNDEIDNISIKIINAIPEIYEEIGNKYTGDDKFNRYEKFVDNLIDFSLDIPTDMSFGFLNKLMEMKNEGNEALGRVFGMISHSKKAGDIYKLFEKATIAK